MMTYGIAGGIVGRSLAGALLCIGVLFAQGLSAGALAQGAMGVRAQGAPGMQAQGAPGMQAQSAPGMQDMKEMPAGEAVATFAGGCFWCVESDFDHVPGVLRTISGYTGGMLKNPTYQQVSAGGTGHIEAVQIYYDPEKVTYQKLLDVFWHSVDPTDAGGQFCDRGRSYETAIFANTAEQKRLAEESRAQLQKSGVLEKPVVTMIETAGAFYPAEDYHQDYYLKNPLRYRLYRYGCGRDGRLTSLWGEDAMRGIEKKE